jgi:hypothetical protein
MYKFLFLFPGQLQLCSENNHLCLCLTFSPIFPCRSYKGSDLMCKVFDPFCIGYCIAWETGVYSQVSTDK